MRVGQPTTPTMMGTLMLIAAGLVILALLVPTWLRPDGIDPGRIQRMCQQYASLDLSGMASICRDAGYQQYVDADGWPIVQQYIQPEDLDR